VADLIGFTFTGGCLTDSSLENSGDSYPDGELTDMVNEDGEIAAPLKQVLKLRKMDRIMLSRERKEKAAIFWLLNELHTGQRKLAKTGARATYHIVKTLLPETPAATADKGWVEMNLYTREMTIASALASMVDVESALAAHDRLDAACRMTGLLGIEIARKMMSKMVGIAESGLTRTMARNCGSMVMAGMANTYCTPGSVSVVFRIGDSKFYLAHKHIIYMDVHQMYVLGRSDYLRAQTMLRSLSSGMYATMAQTACAPGPNRTRVSAVGREYLRYFRMILDMIEDLPDQREVYACKMMKRAYGAWLGTLAGPLCRDETAELIAEAKDTHPLMSKYVAPYMEGLNSWDLGTAFNLGKIYKLCPSPDCSPASTLLERSQVFANANKMDPDWVEAFAEEHLNQLLRAYIRTAGVRLNLRDENKRPAWWGHYRLGDYDRVPSGEIHEYLAWEGSATMPTRTPINPACWKDSGLGWDDYETATDAMRNRRHGNMLMRMIFDPTCPMPGVRYVLAQHFHKIEQKPEGHKDPLRAIFSSNLWDRLIQSWMEEAVTQVTRNHPAFMIGANIATREARVSTLLTRNHNPRELTLYYSFDIKGWSPLMPAIVQRLSHANWAKLYDEPMFRMAHQINEDSTVYMNKNGYTGWIVNPGSNFEGYNAKEMTFILITLMAMSVKEWRRVVVAGGLLTVLEAEELSVTLMAYIDDGLAKSTVRRAIGTELMNIWKECTLRVFLSCGFQLEVKKCYPSDRFAIFLNEVYYMGRQIAHGTRAAMTMCSENVAEKIGLVEKVTAITTGARGAVVAGLDALPAHFLMCYHVWPMIKRAVVTPSPVISAIWSYAPMAWGGLGMPSMLQLSTTGGGSATEEGAHILQRMATVNQCALRYFRNVVSQGYEVRTARSIITAPLGGSVRRGVLSVDLFSGAIRKVMRTMKDKGELSPLASEIISLSDEGSFDMIAEALLGDTTVIQEEVLRDLYKSLPHAIFSSFASRIEKGSTLRKLIGNKEFDRIVSQEEANVRESYIHALRRATT
jgi:hypothetical protein